MTERPPADASMTVEAVRLSRRTRRLTPEQLVEKYAALVTSTSHEISRHLQCPVEFDDLMSWGYQGLLEAHERYKPMSDVTFASYAYYRIRGAMYDGLRQTGWAVRGTAIHIRDSIGINEHLERRTLSHAGTPPPETFEESAERIDKLVGECVTICLLHHAQLDRVSAAVEPTQTSRIEQRDLNIALNAAVEQLSDEEREVLVRYHVNEESMTEIARAMGISTSWVSRINANAITALRDILYEDNEPWQSYGLRP